MNILSKLTLVIQTIHNFPTAILDRMGYLKGEKIYKLRNNNLCFIARAGTEDVAEIAVVASGYEYNIEFVKFSALPIIIDLGGHIGTFSLLMARILGSKCKIFTYEPDPENYSLLERNICINNIRSIYPKNIAITDYVGKGFLKKENMTNDGYYLDTTNKKATNCKVNTLTKALKQYKIQKIDILKMDIEGGEYNILLHKESFNYIKKNVHYILMEYHNIDTRHNYSLIRKIIKSHFRILHKRPNVMTLENRRWKE